MEIIVHRINWCSKLSNLLPSYGAEIDLRSQNSKLILAHDAFTDGDNFDDFLKIWSSKQRGTLILNPKEDGLEIEILNKLKSFNVNNYFFLDLTMPTTIKLSIKQGVRNIALRVSEYETLDSALTLKQYVDWVWLDSFTGKPCSEEILKSIKKHFKICLVSPELPGFSSDTINQFLWMKPYLDAVCTKKPEIWK